jgi:antitoxin (DNA-binding transcriptional repressor) of toxin-antitoxin stability system
MEGGMRTMAAGKFKAQCLAVLDDVKTKREEVLVTKNGKPYAKMVPLALPDDEDPLDVFRFPGKVEILGDIMAPLYSDEEWEQFFENSAAQLK